MTNKELEQKLKEYYGPSTTEEILAAYASTKPITFRVNTIKTTPEEIIATLHTNHIPFLQAPWSHLAFIIKDTSYSTITSLDIYKEGKIYLQSLSSQLPPIFLNPAPNDLILDMTASPGGKTTEIAALTNNQSMITAIEMNKVRCEKLKYNIDIQGAKKVTIINTNAKNIDAYFMFDKILLDAPCSGSGTITKTTPYFSLTFLPKITKTQESLLTEAIKHLKPNGEIIYSTCSILKEENEKIINTILKNNPNIELVPLDLTSYQSIPKLPSTIPNTLTIQPTTTYEGFFIAKLKRIK